MAMQQPTTLMSNNMQQTQQLPLIHRLTRFSVTGGSSTAVHFCSVLLLVSLLHMTPLIANIGAFLIAFSVSYIGHSRWTFADINQANRKQTLCRFFMIAVFSFVLNESLYVYLLKVQHLYYPIALAIVLCAISVVTFTLSKCWAFRPEKTQPA